MSHKNVLKRAWEMLWQYRVLWLFGMLLALTTTSFSPQSSFNFSGNDFGRQGDTRQIDPGADFWQELADVFEEINQEIRGNIERNLNPQEQRTVLNTIIAVAVLALSFTIVGVFLRYVSETALIRMVDDYEDSGEKLGFRQGFKLGWSKAAWRLFLIDLVIAIPLVIVFGGLTVLAAIPFINGFSGNDISAMLGVLTTIGFSFLILFFGLIVGVLISALKEFFRRVSVLDDVGVFDSIRQGWEMVRQHFKDVGVMWLIMLGINIGWPLVLLPFGIMFGGLALLFGGGASLTLGSLTGAFTGDVNSIISTIVVAVAFFFLLFVLPIVALNGIKTTYQSSAWTLTFRELRALGSMAADEPPELEEPAAG